MFGLPLSSAPAAGGRSSVPSAYMCSRDLMKTVSSSRAILASCSSARCDRVAKSFIGSSAGFWLGGLAESLAQGEESGMVFGAAHWEQLRRDGYTVVSGAIPTEPLRAAQDAAERLNARFPEGWERSKNESWREIRYCREPAFMALVADILDPLALEILES